MNAVKTKGNAVAILLAFSCGCHPSLAQPKPKGDSSAQEQSQSQATAAKGKPPAKLKIAPDVYQRLEQSRDGRVYVMVTLRPLPKEAASDAQRTLAAAKSQDELVTKMSLDDFEVGHRHESDPILFGHVNAAGLKELERDQNVESVQFKVVAAVHRRLKEDPGEFVHVLVAVHLSDEETKEIDELERAVGQAHDSASAELQLAALKKLVDRIRNRVLSGLARSDFRLHYGSPFDADAWGLARRAAIEQLTKRADVEAIGYNPKEGDD